MYRHDKCNNIDFHFITMADETNTKEIHLTTVAKKTPLQEKEEEREDVSTKQEEEEDVSTKQKEEEDVSTKTICIIISDIFCILLTLFEMNIIFSDYIYMISLLSFRSI